MSYSLTTQALRRMAATIEQQSITAAAGSAMKWKYAVPEPKQAAVLAMLVATTSPASHHAMDALSVLFTVRSRMLRKHAGEVSFPGGALDATDSSILAAALRETREEIGVESVLVLGALPTLPDRSLRIKVSPFLGVACWRPYCGGDLDSAAEEARHWGSIPESQMGSVRVKTVEELGMTMNRDEVDSCFSVTLRDLLDPKKRRMQDFRDGTGLKIPVWNGPNNEQIWGLTAFVLDNLLKTVVAPSLDVEYGQTE
ncbi:hypothetical protein CcCBS67573_g09792 [Chytriomyces confervae]|uniref:Nudix hydrolase domain-containing protein n=1 Tax=Chytriomyces confervae TaxID=246404 RepID=A0A507DNS7_9FUNG|nr:hypothetical protein CcCBS67573_g09792 [Chytriomyces confervae]